jgi:hypothetical protein
MKMRTMSLAVVLGFSLASPAVFAETPAKKTMSSDPAVAARQETHKAGAADLKASLPIGKDKAFYRLELEKMGYAITAVNSDKKDYLEYEVVKSGQSWEVQVDFKNGMSSKVDIDSNIWKADSTKAALKDKDYKYVYPAGTTANPERVSDRTRGAKWAGEKKTLEKELQIS